MIKSGLIKKFVPILDRSAAHEGIDAFVTLKPKAGQTNSVSKKLVGLEEVSSIFVTTGENNITLRVNCDDSKRFQDFLYRRLPRVVDGEVVSSQVIVSTVKEEQPMRLTNQTAIRLKCDYCKGDVTTSRPYNIRVGQTYHYFCCRTCRRSYLEKYGQRIKRINAGRRTSLHS
jgi:DNA-binding Lrp family transcriptional regulator